MSLFCDCLFGSDRHRESLQRPLLSAEGQSVEMKAEYRGLDGCSWKIPSNEVDMGTRIATGTYGTVFKGTFRARKVAVKQLKQDNHFEARKFEETVLAEAAFLSNLQHPSIVKFYGVAKEDDPDEPGSRAGTGPGRLPGYLVVTELCDAALDKIQLGIGTASSEHLWAIIVQVAEGMRFLHSKKVMHRDLKPANVLVVEYERVSRPDIHQISKHSSKHSSNSSKFSSMDLTNSNGGIFQSLTSGIFSSNKASLPREPNGTRVSTGGRKLIASGRFSSALEYEFKLCDFGMARVIQDSMPSMTTGIGTPSYMSPELLAGYKGRLSQFPWASDSYSFGVMMWMVLSGKKPYADAKSTSPFEVLRRVVEGDRPEIPQEWPAEIAGIIRKCWSADAAARPGFEELCRIFGASHNGCGILQIQGGSLPVGIPRIMHS